MSHPQTTHNPHPDFKTVEATRPPFDHDSTFHLTKTINPDWTPGSGANEAVAPASTTASTPPHVSIDPYEEGRNPASNYKLLISSIIPRPVAFLSTVSVDGRPNLAPFSYFSVIGHDPPLFTVGFALRPDGHPDGPNKDSLRNLLKTGECVINIISESFVEAANSCSVDSPHGVSEWDVAGLTPVHDCRDVRPARVGEAVFSVEGKLESHREFESRATKGKKTSALVVIEGTRFWARQDAINEERNILDPNVLRPVSRLGGIMYGRLTEALEIPRVDFKKDIGGMEGYEKFMKDKQDKEVQGKSRQAN